MNDMGRTGRRLAWLGALVIAGSLAGIGCGPKMESPPMTPEPTSGIEAPEAVPGPDLAVPVKEGVDIAGFDLGRVDVPVGDVAACQQRCDARADCLAWTLYPSEGACWLKSGVERLHPSVYAVSGLRSGAEWPVGLR